MGRWHNEIQIGGAKFFSTEMGCGHMQSKGLHTMIQYEKDFESFKTKFKESKHLFLNNKPLACSTIFHVDGENYMDCVEGGLTRYLKCMKELGFKVLTKYKNLAHPEGDVQYLFVLTIE